MDEKIEELIEEVEFGTEMYFKLLSERTEEGSDGYNYFMEKDTREKSAKALLELMISHIFKLKYRIGTDQIDSHWIDEIYEKRNTIQKKVGWRRKRKATTIINSLARDLNDIYKSSINSYTDEIPDYTFPKLPEISGVVPEECPWIIEELIGFVSIEDFDEILSKLPEMKEK